MALASNYMLSHSNDGPISAAGESCGGLLPCWDSFQRVARGENVGCLLYRSSVLSRGTHRYQPEHVLAIVVKIMVMLCFVLGGERNVLAAVAGTVILWYSIMHPPVGMAAFIVTLPYSPMSLSGIGMSPFLIWTPAFIVGSTIHYALDRVSLRNTLRDIGLLSAFVLLIALSSANTLSLAEVARVAVSYSCLAAIAILICSVSARFEDGLAWLVGSCVAVAGTAVVASLLVGVEGRMALDIQEEGGSGVSPLTNPVSLAYAAIYLCIAAKLGVSMPGVRVPKIGLGLGLTLMFTALLVCLMAMSRGTILAMATLLVMSGLAIQRDRQRSLVRMCIVALVLVTCLAACWKQIDGWTKGGLNNRTVTTISEARGLDVRLRIWGAGLGQMTTTEWILGSGAGLFRERAFGRYEHSVFVSILHTGGIVGAALLGLLFFRWGRIAARRGRLRLYLVIASYIGAKFLTHGSLSTKSFWVFVGLLGAIAYAGSHTTIRQPGRRMELRETAPLA